jgi:site-specific recombinase
VGSELVLTDLLCQTISGGTLPERMFWFEQVLHWLFQGDPQKVETRFRFFFQVLDKNPEWKIQFTDTVLSVVAETRFLSFFTQVGLAVEHGLWGDIAGRVFEKIIPMVRKADFQEIFLNVFTTEERINEIESLSPETVTKIKELFSGPEALMTWPKITRQANESLLLLSSHVVHYGMSSEIRTRLPEGDRISASSFFKLAQSTAARQNEIQEGLIEECEKDVATVYESLEKNGVSVDVVNRLETITAVLLRMRRVHQLLDTKQNLATEVQDFVAETMKTGLLGQSVFGHVKRHFYLLSRKIVERNGNSGDHYIARSGSEMRALLSSAVGGGCIVVFMTILKTRLILLHPAPFFLASGIWIIYACGFLTMQFSGATLATKIPSFTASRLAGLLQTVRKSNADEFHAEFKLVLKSQGIALFGNLLGVIPLVLLLNYGLQFLFGISGVMDEHYAQHTLHDLNPFLSFAVFLGALTGVQLWLSSVAGGWFENWVVFKQLPEAIRTHHRFRKIFGEATANKVSDFILHHSSGVATNIALGFLFGFVPLFGTIFGANWNGNHVTISTAGAAFAVSSLNFELSGSEWSITALGLFLIAVMNFFVSFGLALWIAANAQNVKFRRALYYLSAGFKK